MIPFGSEWFFSFVVIITGIYYMITKNNNYFKNRGVNFIKPVPFFGNMLDVTFSRRNFIEILQYSYDKFSESNFFGLFEYTSPVYVIRNTELIKKIAIKDFDHFTNHRITLEAEVEPIFGRIMFFTKDQRWKDMRSTISPAFTGSKIRKMFHLIDECSKQSCDYLMRNVNKEFELKDLFGRIGNDVMATCAFGLSVDSLDNPKNEFYKRAKEMSNFAGFTAIKMLLSNTYPKIMKFLNLRMTSTTTSLYMKKMIMETINQRKESKIVRQDMIDLVIEAQKGVLKHSSTDKFNDAGFATVEESNIGKTSSRIEWEDDDFVAQCVVFLLAGIDTTATLISFLCHELAVNPDVQEKLFNEIDLVNKQLNLNEQSLNYETLNKMNYLDMVVSETLRKWPPAITIDRKCNKEYILKSNDENDVLLKPGDGIYIPVFSIHRDPKFYQNPEKFDPERFSDENKGLIQAACYLPFGVGPRNCIGSRLALMETKAVIFNILSRFTIERTENTQDPLQLKKNVLLSLYAEKGMFVKFSPRD